MSTLQTKRNATLGRQANLAESIKLQKLHMKRCEESIANQTKRHEARLVRTQTSITEAEKAIAGHEKSLKALTKEIASLEKLMKEEEEKKDS